MLSPRFSLLRLAVLLSLVLVAYPALSPVAAQPTDAYDAYDASWYDADAPHVRIAVVEDGVYRVSGSDVASALPSGTTLDAIDPSTLRLLENGTEIPIALDGGDDGAFDPGDTFAFVGQRNRGDDEVWAYNYDENAQSSRNYSLYTDTTYYWLTWGGAAGRRYTEATATPTAAPTTALRDTLRSERDEFYYFGRAFENGDARYTQSEGYYWNKFTHNATGTLDFDHTLPVDDHADTDATLALSLRFDAETSSCHRVEVLAALAQDGGGVAYESLVTEEWRGYARRTLTASIDQRRIVDEGLRIRIRSYNTTFNDTSCPDPASTPNYVLLDWIEAAYTRTLTAATGTPDAQRFVAPAAQPSTFVLEGHAGASVNVYNEADARRYTVPITSGTATVADTPSQAATAYWAVGATGARSPAAVLPDAPSNWSVASAHSADYLILTTAALLPAAQDLADYRQSHSGYEVEVALVQDVFDEFDYGRPTPLAIRRFVRASQTWATAPRFLSIYADAQYPIYTGIDVRRPEWHVPAFGYSPSDGWFAMQVNGVQDWEEQIAIGRIPVRSVAQGDLFLQKLQAYEASTPAAWQKRMLLLAGGTSASEQRSLQFYSDNWGRVMSDTTASVNGRIVPVHTGADTLRYYKQATDALDNTFQDSLGVDIARGSGWLNYFGHSAAQTWEIVTDRPSEFNNAGTLPIIVSLGCRTGAFAGGRFEVKSAPSLGEQLVVGSVDENGVPRPGSLNGGIAHFGESALGNRLPSADINDELIEAVFVDTMRVLGEAIRVAKADVADVYGRSNTYAKHLLQYGLLGDPATEIALPSRPDFAIASPQIDIQPTAPQPSDEFVVTVTPQNYGLIPSDSVDVVLSWSRPDGSTVEEARRIERFRLESELVFRFPIDEDALGENVFRVTLDPADAYAEANETNNTVVERRTVFSTGLALAYPVEQGLVSEARPRLRVNVLRQTLDPVTVTTQLDTVPTFDSPALREQQQSVASALAAWQPSTDLLDGTTYFWRARLAAPTVSDWRTGSFTVQTSAASAGWSQQGPLFDANENERLLRDASGWTFDVFERDVLVSAEIGGGSFKGQINIGGTQEYVRRTLGYGIVVVNGETGVVKGSSSFCTYDVSDSFLNDTRCADGVDGSAAVDAMDAFLETTVADGDYVFVRTRNLVRSGSSTIQPEVRTVLKGLGGPVPATPYTQAIDTLDYGDVWLMATRKGFPETTEERAVDPSTVNPEDRELVYRSRYPFKHPNGATTTPLIGPATAWDAVSWQADAASASGTLRVEVLDASGSTVLAQQEGLSGTVSLSDIDASSHPYILLRGVFEDEANRRSPNLNVWSVTYTGVPEIVLDGAPLQTVSDSLQEGATADVTLPVHNLGPVAAEEVRVEYRWTDAANATTRVAVDTVSVAPFDSTATQAAVSTANRSGENLLTVEARSNVLERLTFNNTAVRNLTVTGDLNAPSLRVLVNGRELPPTPPSLDYLQDPTLPFVSITPSLEILVSDENPFLSLTDTSYVDVYLKGGLPEEGPSIPGQSDFRRISFAGPSLAFEPPSEDGPNEARVLFTPRLSERDSTYTLKVEARDTQNNEVDPYQVSFRVQQDQTVEAAYPYPNPMSTHTTFAFRVVGGSDSGLDARLRIYTLAGRLIRELEGIAHVGWNTMRWNGRDADGDRVATGVYLYRVRVESEDETFEGEVEKVAVIR